MTPEEKIKQAKENLLYDAGCFTSKFANSSEQIQFPSVSENELEELLKYSKFFNKKPKQSDGVGSFLYFIGVLLIIASVVLAFLFGFNPVSFVIIASGVFLASLMFGLGRIIIILNERL